MILRRLARPLLAATFISGGIDTLRNPKPRIEAARPLLDKTVGQFADSLPDRVPTDAERLVKIDAAVKVGAGVLFALGKFPRLSALALAGSLVPTTLAGHSFWEHEDPTKRTAQRIHFLKNVGLIGGLLIASADTEGKPSLGWRTRRAARKANRRAGVVFDAVQDVPNRAKDLLPG